MRHQNGILVYPSVVGDLNSNFLSHLFFIDYLYSLVNSSSSSKCRMGRPVYAKAKPPRKQLATKQPRAKPRAPVEPYKPDALRCGSANANQNLSLAVDPPLAVDYRSLKPCAIPANWGSKSGAEAACKGREHHSRLAGFLSFTLDDVSNEELVELTRPKSVISVQGCDADGEFSTPLGQIPLSRLLDPLDGDERLSAIWALQSPTSSPWKLPFIRCVSNHQYKKASKGNGKLEIKIYVYLTRSLFELIADPAIKTVMDHIEGFPVERIPVTKSPKQPIMFTKSPLNEEYSFTLPGLLKHAESTGYQSVGVFPRQPEALAVDLFDFQRSTYEWMQDREAEQTGINARFWEELIYRDGGGSMYYFPLAGEFRLMKPPITTGGLLCEEMGLGKTVICIALVLGNPGHSQVGKPVLQAEPVGEKEKGATPRSLLSSNATLIVVPSTLVGQWYRELHNRVKPGNYQLKVINAADLHNKLVEVDIENVRLVKSESGHRGKLEKDSSLFDWGMGFADMLDEKKYADFKHPKSREINREIKFRGRTIRDVITEKVTMDRWQWQVFLGPLRACLPTKGDMIEVRCVPNFPPEMTFVIPAGDSPIVNFLQNSTTFQDQMEGLTQKENIIVALNLDSLFDVSFHKVDVILTTYGKWGDNLSELLCVMCCMSSLCVVSSLTPLSTHLHLHSFRGPLPRKKSSQRASKPIQAHFLPPHHS